MHIAAVLVLGLLLAARSADARRNKTNEADDDRVSSGARPADSRRPFQTPTTRHILDIFVQVHICIYSVIYEYRGREHQHKDVVGQT